MQSLTTKFENNSGRINHIVYGPDCKDIFLFRLLQHRSATLHGCQLLHTQYNAENTIAGLIWPLEARAGLISK